MRVFMRGLVLKGVVVKDNHKIIHVHNLEELAERIKAYIDLQRSKEKQKSVRQGYMKEATPSSKLEVRKEPNIHTFNQRDINNIKGYGKKQFSEPSYAKEGWGPMGKT